VVTKQISAVKHGSDNALERKGVNMKLHLNPAGNATSMYQEKNRKKGVWHDKALHSCRNINPIG
jgi:hypothetical protein